MNCQFQNSQRLPGGLPLGENLILLFFIQHMTINHKCSLHTFSVSMFPSLSHPHLSLLTVREKCGGRGKGGGGRASRYESWGCERLGAKLDVPGRLAFVLQTLTFTFPAGRTWCGETRSPCGPSVTLHLEQLLHQD